VTGCRFRGDVGYEGRCNACAEWWPLTDEFWYPRQGMARCRACINDGQTRRARRARLSQAEQPALLVDARRRRNREWMRAKRARAKLSEAVA
jgi:hypothetical protein